MEINLFFESHITLRNKKALRLFIAGLFKKENKQLASLNYIFCSDEQLLDINRKFLNHDYYTDIITFNLSASKKTPITGEVYISTDRVRENARLNRKTIENELHRVIFHGALHLCGYKDKTPAAQKQMRQKEDAYLNAYGF